MNQPLFELGSILATGGVFDLTMKQDGLDVSLYLYRHVTGDWGEMSEDDMEMNKEALEHGDRIFSAYETPFGKIWIITESDRSTTTILLPGEY